MEQFTIGISPDFDTPARGALAPRTRIAEQVAEDTGHRLLQLDNVIVTSHSFDWIEDSFRDMVREACSGALEITQGQPPPNVVNRAKS